MGRITCLAARKRRQVSIPMCPVRTGDKNRSHAVDRRRIAFYAALDMSSHIAHGVFRLNLPLRLLDAQVKVLLVSEITYRDTSTRKAES